MRRCIFSFFCVFLVLGSCSPKVYSGAQDVQAFQSSAASDSTRLERLVDERVEARLSQYLERHAELEQETVSERLSAPDSAGRQYVEERSTTRSVARSKTTAGSFSEQIGQTVQQTDSVVVRDTAAVAEIQEHQEDSAGPARRPWMPWYVYVAGLVVAALIGLLLGIKLEKKI